VLILSHRPLSMSVFGGRRAEQVSVLRPSTGLL